MPTGYTAKLHDGEAQTFEEFLLSCAREFGALITMRDDPADAPIPDEFEPSPFYKEQLDKDTAENARLGAMTLRQAAIESDAEYATLLAEWHRSEERRKLMRSRYEAMLEQVAAWEPPTPDHQGLKDFMAEQLRESIRFDCEYHMERPVKMAGKDWLRNARRRAQERLIYSQQHWTEEQDRAATRTAWVQALRDSLSERVWRWLLVNPAGDPPDFRKSSEPG